jgi:hypothetical protein
MACKSGLNIFPLQFALRKPAWFALLLVCAAFAVESSGMAASMSPRPFALHKAAVHFAIADFDGDTRPDFASVETEQIGASHARYWIGFRMSAGFQQRIGVTAPVGGLAIDSRDVNGDKYLDLIVSTAWLNSPVVILVNDGHGNFTVSDPAVFSAIVWNPKRVWAPPSSDGKDTAIAVLTRGNGDCALNDRLSGRSFALQPLVVETSCHAPLCTAIAALGRAPPLVLDL